MKKTIIYSLILLTVLSLSLTMVPHTSAQTQNVKILTHSWYIDSLGLLVVVGEVQNTGPNTIQTVILGGAASGSDGTTVEANPTPAYVQYLAPNQKAPFYIEFYDQNGNNNGIWPSQDVSNIDLAVINADPTANYTYPDVKVQNSQGAASQDGVYWVTGSVKNTGSQTAQNVMIIGTFYNQENTVVATGYSQTLTPASLTPQNTATFKLGAFDLNQTIIPAAQKIAKYDLLVQVEGPILVGNAPIVTPYQGDTQATPMPSATATGGGPTGFPPNSQDSNTTEPLPTTVIIGIVIAVTIAIVAVAIVMMRKRKSQTQESTEPQRNQPKKTPKRERR